MLCQKDSCGGEKKREKERKREKKSERAETDRENLFVRVFFVRELFSFSSVSLSLLSLSLTLYAKNRHCRKVEKKKKKRSTKHGRRSFSQQRRDSRFKCEESV